jgi:hypothetical protein
MTGFSTHRNEPYDTIKYDKKVLTNPLKHSGYYMYHLL